MLDRQARLAAALAFVLSLAGACSLVLPFGELQTGSGGAGGSSTASGAGGCAAHQKLCGSTCVSNELPKNGCGQSSCRRCESAGGKTLCIGTTCAQEPTLLADHLADPWAVTFDETDVYWSEQGDPGVGGGGIHRVALDGGAKSPLASAPHAQALTLSGDSVFFSTYKDDGSNQDGIWVVGKTGTPPAKNFAPSAAHQLGTIGVSDATAYWSNFTAGTVVKSSVAPATLTTLYSPGSDTQPHSIVVDTEVVFGSESGASSVFRMGLNGMGRSILTTTAPSPPGFIAVDQTTVYVAGTGKHGSVFSLSRLGSDQTPHIIESDVTNAGAIAVSGDYVYWVSGPPEGAPAGTPGSISRRLTNGKDDAEVLVQPTTPRGIAVTSSTTAPVLYYLDAGAGGAGAGSLWVLPLLK